MKRIQALCLVAALSLGLAGCQSNAGGHLFDGLPNQGQGSQEPERQEPTADLSAYDEHGDWHCGRMWVHRTDSGYDHCDGYYAYIDEAGNLITEWHSDQEWIVPFDFDQDVALVYTGRQRAVDQGVEYSQYSQPVSYDLIGLNGNLITSFAASAYFYSYRNGRTGGHDVAYSFEGRNDNWANGHFNRNGGNHPTPHAFDQYGQLFFNLVYDDPLGYGNHICGLLFTDGTYLEFWYSLPPDELENYCRYKMDLNGFGEQFVNGYLSYHDYVSYGGGGSYDIYLFFDMAGSVAVDLTDFAYPIQSVSDISLNGTIDVTFRGVDGNSYLVTVDMAGEWLTEPVAVN